MKFIIEQELAQAILNYLVDRPYREVAAMVSGLQAIPVVPELADPETLTEEPSTV